MTKGIKMQFCSLLICSYLLIFNLTESLSVVHQQISRHVNDEMKVNNPDSPHSQPHSGYKTLPTTATDFITSFNQPLTHARYSCYDLQARLTTKALAKIKLASLSVAKEAARSKST